MHRTPQRAPRERSCRPCLTPRALRTGGAVPVDQPPLMLIVALRTPLLRLQPSSSGCPSSHELDAPRSAAPGPFLGDPVKGLPIPDPEHLRSCSEPCLLSHSWPRRLSEVDSSGSAPHVPVRLLTTARRLSALRRFLPARHSPGSRPLERAPERCQGTSDRLLPPKNVSTSLHPCSRSSTGLTGLAPGPFEELAGSRRRTRCGGTARWSAGYSPAGLVTTFTV